MPITFPRRLLSLLLVATFVITSFGLAFSHAPVAIARETVPETANYVPATALAYVTADLDSSSPQWTQAQALGERIGRTITPERLFELFSQTVLGSSDVIDASDFLGGDVAIAVTNPDLNGMMPSLISGGALSQGSTGVIADAATKAAQSGYVLIALPKDPSIAEVVIKTALQRIAENNGVTIKEEEHGGVVVTWVAGDEVAGTPGVAYARIDDALVAAPTVKDLLPVLDLRVNGGDSLATVPRFEQVIRPLPDDSLALGVVNGSQLAADIGPEADKNLPGIDAITNGINAFTAFSVSAVDDGFQTDTRSVGEAGGKIFGDADNFTPSLIDQMPADTQIFVDGMDFSSTGLLDAIGVIGSQFLLGALAGMSSASPAATPEVDPATVMLPQAANEAFGQLALLFGVNLKSQLIDKLDGEYAFGLWGLNSTDATGVNAAFIAQTSDPTAVDASLNALTSFVGLFAQNSAAITPTTIDGVPMSSIDLSGSGVSNPVVIGVDKDQMIVGIGDGANDAISGPTDQLAGTELFQSATASLPTERNAMLFVNLSELQSTVNAATASITGDATPDVSPAATTFTTPQAFAVVGFKDNLLAGTQGLLYIPA
jgi:hypothetical protein